MLLTMAPKSWAAADYKVLYSFTSKNSNPSSGLVTDAEGNAYGVTSGGGVENSGTAYELSPTTGYHLLHSFGPKDPAGQYPVGNMVLDATGNLYGTTYYGGNSGQNCALHTCGAVFELSPPSGGAGQWTETVVYSFCSKAGCMDGANPFSGVILDSAGNLYGTTSGGGNNGSGTVFELSQSSDGWTEDVLYRFGNGKDDGSNPEGALVFDSIGNLYGSTAQGGESGAGTVFELSPGANGWTEAILYSFDFEDGYGPNGVVMDPAGNLYGSTNQGGIFTCSGADGCGTVFELTPSDGNWTETVLHNFGDGRLDGILPLAGLVLDASGNLYGTTYRGGGSQGCQSRYGCGTVFKLSPGVGGQWTETLFRFPESGLLGGVPAAQVTLDSTGNVYGTTTLGGTDGVGVAFKITQ
jgi:uncharacterized repeat protein (TIGR03803 family)